MRSQVRALTIALGLFCAASAFAQTAAPVAAKASAPAAVTAPAATTPAPKSAATPAAKVAAPAAAVAAGGGDGKVWVNTKSKVYHYGFTAWSHRSAIDEGPTGAPGIAPRPRFMANSRPLPWSLAMTRFQVRLIL